MEEIEGLEYDWIAVDSNGFLAFLTTAGVAFAPQSFLDDIEIYDSVIEEILGLPETTSAVFFPDLTSDSDNLWKKMAERGIFAYDASYEGMNYSLVARPSDPILISSLPYGMQNILKKVVLNDFEFPQGKDLVFE